MLGGGRVLFRGIFRRGIEFGGFFFGVCGGGFGGPQGDGVLDVELGELLAELFKAMEVVDVLAQKQSLVGGHAAGLVAAVLPDLEFEIGSELDGAAVGGWSLDILLGERASAHLCDGAEFFKDGLTGGGCGWRIHQANNYLCT